MHYRENSKLGLVEFSQTFFENLDTLIATSQLNVENDRPFFEEVCFKLFDLYQREGSDYSVLEMLRFVHVFLYSMYKHKPSVEKNDDEIKLY
jgi:hypothetical protein